MSGVVKVRRRTGWKMTGLGVLSIGVALMLSAGVGAAAQPQPGEAAPGGLGRQAVPALAQGSTYLVQNIPFNAIGSRTGDGSITLSNTNVATNLYLSLYSPGRGYVNISGTAQVNTYLTVSSVSGGTPTSSSVLISGSTAFAQGGLYVYAGVNTMSIPIVFPTLSGTVNVIASPPGGFVSVGVAGMVGGYGPVTLSPYLYPSYLYYGFVPIVGNGGAVSSAFSDDFSNSDGGWVAAGVDGDTDVCSYEYTNGHYRLNVKHKDRECVAWNYKHPEWRVAAGTFQVEMRRTTGNDRVPVWAGMWFGQTTQDASDNHYWAHLRLDPTDCNGDPSVLWTGAVVDGDEENFHDKCNDDVDTDSGDWNKLKIIRGNDRVKYYINGTLERDEADNYLSGLGWFDLIAVSDWSDTSSSEPVVVEFDDFSITTATTP